MFAVFKAEAIFAASRQKVILYKTVIHVLQSLFLLKEQRSNEGSFEVVFFSKETIILIVGELFVPFLLELKSKNICINKDYGILLSSQTWLQF